MFFNILLIIPIISCIPLALIGVLFEEFNLNKKVGKFLQKTGAFFAGVVFLELFIFMFAAITEDIGLIHWKLFEPHEEINRGDKWKDYVVECIDIYSMDSIEVIDSYIASKLKNNNALSIASIKRKDVISYSSKDPDGYVTFKIAYKNSKKKVKVNVPYELLFPDSSNWEYYLSLI